MSSYTKRSKDIPLPAKEKDNPDYRQPLYLGTWKKSIPYIDDDIAIDDMDEPHMKRKVTIIKKYPEIEKLYGYDLRTLPLTIIACFMQVMAAYVFGKILIDWNLTMLFYGYFIGAFISQLFGVVIHEACHCLIAPTVLQNRIIGLIANIGLPFPIAMSFRRYHLEHHTYQGVLGSDPDLPLEWEKKMIRGNAFLKFLWLNIYPIMYVVRGLAMQKSPSFWEYVNWVFTITTDIMIYKYCGLRGLIYLVLSLWFGFGAHPAAGHFIQEHYTFEDGQETYSYYGSLNIVLINIGYHNEHHDFVKVPWANLPQVRKIASEYYDNLSYHTSWVMLLWNFVMEKQLGPQSRVGRTPDDHKKGRKMLKVIKEQ
ncbi:15584_t:CDS:2 [Entrophospora sp. SA101]|nr:10_t:CDS:2 [Entrophospora candida]CAH1763921.1 13402_t:CDS:2 [Entrophospora sp. SA101]CAJ0635588.1 920_t:CDS:2 [Entrophospora sp. SA101]CAJ0635593.1 15584_t:CDS:2 [Entrophospora sp. SA101]CAJ0824007.1 12605_t:CDS:2 [Entrophospora sp. SA101]